MNGVLSTIARGRWISLIHSISVCLLCGSGMSILDKGSGVQCRRRSLASSHSYVELRATLYHHLWLKVRILTPVFGSCKSLRCSGRQSLLRYSAAQPCCAMPSVSPWCSASCGFTRPVFSLLCCDAVHGWPRCLRRLVLGVCLRQSLCHCLSRGAPGLRCCHC